MEKLAIQKAILKEVLYRLSPSIFKEFIEWELNHPDYTPEELFYELVRKVEIASISISDKRVQLNEFANRF
jgi:hypothetical protein